MTVKDMTFDLDDGLYRLRQGRVENTWWSLEKEGGGTVKAIMAIYVDDFLIAGESSKGDSGNQKDLESLRSSGGQARSSSSFLGHDHRGSR